MIIKNIEKETKTMTDNKDINNDVNKDVNNTNINDELKKHFEKVGMEYDEKIFNNISDEAKQDLLNQIHNFENQTGSNFCSVNGSIDDDTDDDGIDPSDVYDINIQHPTTDPDVLALRALSPAERLYYFLDDIVPKKDNDSAVIVTNCDPDDNHGFGFTLIPNSVEIFEQISNMPNHAASMYPDMTKYFDDIIWLYNHEYSPNNNPYWDFKPLTVIPLSATANFIAAHAGKLKTFISLEPKQNSIPYRLCYGDNRHQNDFVGIVYLYFI